MKRIYAFIKLRSPLHIAAPDNLRFNPDNGESSHGVKGGMACTAVQRLPVLGANGKTFAMPVIAANNIAGRLRRHGAAIILDALRAKGQKVSLPTYSILQCGAATGKPDGKPITYGDYKKTREHPYLGLFGGGPKMLRRGFRVHNSLPVTTETSELLGSLAHPAAWEHLQDGVWFTKVWGFRRNDDLRMLAGIAQAESSIKDFTEEFEKRQALIIEESSKEREEGGSKASTFTYSAVEFVVPGVVFGFTAELDVDPAQTGLFLESMDRFAALERLGGHSRNGFGAFTFEDVRMIDDEGREYDGIFHDGRLNRGNPLVQGILEIWKRAEARLDAGELESLVPLPTETKKAKVA
ncbi:type IV CRISPR-associated protein Csf2 [Acidithiobacillus ferriphilus]|uniref:type IV CRISPR-associated protein Csf2 n=1 Tax=Acidithiobacillus ferriphilus TaxID=1689834 RepID=UPI001C064926|nr:type IV CRISPR-associated protein Csf2 [Acidithiobacillus ferriphilus]MBU2786267.1 type IV CRISPR-associated protein Csf2 [Acidithiobacillus ferriphilus]